MSAIFFSACNPLVSKSSVDANFTPGLGAPIAATVIVPNAQITSVTNKTFANSSAVSVDIGTSNLTPALFVDSSGRFVYSVNSSNTVSKYTVNPTTGALTWVADVATGSNPNSVVSTP